MPLNAAQRRLLRTPVTGQPYRERSFRQAPSPAGYKHTTAVRIPRYHQSSTVMQDRIEETKVRQLRHEPPGPYRDWLVRDLEGWRQNGRPTYYQPPRHATREQKDRGEPRPTWRAGKPITEDWKHDYDESIMRRALKGRSIR